MMPRLVASAVLLLPSALAASCAADAAKPGECSNTSGTTLLQMKGRVIKRTGALADGSSCPETVPNWQKWAALDYSTSTPCDASDDHHCFGNGDCQCGVCVCNVGWRGPYCSQLDLLPAKRAAPGIAMNGGHPTWGGAAVYEGGKWLLLTGSKIANTASASLDPYTYWGRSPEYNQTAAAVGADPYGGAHPWEFTVDPAKDPFPSGGNQIDSSRDLYEAKTWLSLFESSGSDAGGPYTEVVPKWFRAFRADFKTDPNGVLLELSNANGGFTILQSPSGSVGGPWLDHEDNAIHADWAGASGTDPTTTTTMPKPVYKFVDNGHCVEGWNSLGSLAGKYVTRHGGVFRECNVSEKDAWNCHLADPALLVHSNGTTVIAYRGTRCESANGITDHTERIGLLVAPSWKGPYTAGASQILPDTAVMAGGLEDLFMWADSRGTHMVVHSQATDHAYDDSLDRAGVHHKKKRGAYLFSKDGRDRWSLSDWELFPSEIRWDDGTTQFLLKQQRPSLLFGSTGLPTHLITGVDFIYDPCCDWYAYGSAWTLVQPISSCPAGQILDTSSPPVCTACGAGDAAYFGHCLRATSKYGECVCAECESGYSGDACEIGNLVAYGMVCGAFQSSHRCEDMQSTQVAKFRPAQTEASWCQAQCQQQAESQNTAGCCYHYVKDSKKACRFYDGQDTFHLSPPQTSKSASTCERARLN